MKKLFIILFAALVLFPTTARPQFLHYFGVKAGLSSSSQTLEHPYADDSNFHRRIDFSCAIFADIPVMAGFSISPQIEYAQRGFREDNLDGTGRVRTFGVYLDYLMIPLFIKYSADFSFGVLSLEAGPRYDIYLRMRSDGLWFQEDKNILGLSFGTSYAPKLRLPFTPFIEFTYYMDLTNAYEDSYYNYFAHENINIKIRNNSYAINLGVKF